MRSDDNLNQIWLLQRPVYGGGAVARVFPPKRARLCDVVVPYFISQLYYTGFITCCFPVGWLIVTQNRTLCMTVTSNISMRSRPTPCKYSAREIERELISNPKFRVRSTCRFFRSISRSRPKPMFISDRNFMTHLRRFSAYAVWTPVAFAWIPWWFPFGDGSMGVPPPKFLIPNTFFQILRIVILEHRVLPFITYYWAPIWTYSHCEFLRR